MPKPPTPSTPRISSGPQRAGSVTATVSADVSSGRCDVPTLGSVDALAREDVSSSLLLAAASRDACCSCSRTRSSESTDRSSWLIAVDSARDQSTGTPSAIAPATEIRRSLASAMAHHFRETQHRAMDGHARRLAARLPERRRQLVVVVAELQPSDDRLLLLGLERRQRGVVARERLAADGALERAFPGRRNHVLERRVHRPPIR